MMDDPSPQIERVGILRLGLVLLGVPQLIVGGWALLDPAGWHAQLGDPMGPFNEHLAKDVGAALAALGVMVVGATIHVRIETLRLVLGGWLVFAFPHALYHGLHTHGWGLMEMLNAGGMVFFVVLPLLLLLGLFERGFFRQSDISSAK